MQQNVNPTTPFLKHPLPSDTIICVQDSGIRFLAWRRQSHVAKKKSNVFHLPNGVDKKMIKGRHY